VKSAEKISNNDILEMVSPWLGDGSSLSILPVPVLIALEVQSDITEKQIENLQYIISTIDPASRLDTHQMWLNQILRFTGAIQMSIFVLVVVIALITIMAVAGVVRARLAAHVADVELLHLMGATDDYIARQFQGHILSLSLRGCIAGSLLSIAVIVMISVLSDILNIGFLPDFSFGFFEVSMLLTVPCFILVLGLLTAKRTVFSALRKMP
jgi:cell division transport system permease protein